MRRDTWRTLTAEREKLELLAGDRHFLNGLADAREILGGRLDHLLSRHAVMVIQPDCIARRMARRCVEFVTRHGFEPVHVVRLHLDPYIAGALWYYQSNASTQDSCDVGDIICGKSDSLLVLLRDNSPDPVVPSSLRLTRLKGPSDPARRTPAQLRTAIGAPNRLIVLVHTADEPVDMIREAAIMCGASARDLYAAMASPVPDDAGTRLMAHIVALYGDTEPHDMDPGGALTRLVSRIAAIGSDRRRAPAARRLLTILERVGGGLGTPLRWRPFATDLRLVGIDPEDWDAILVASQHVELDVPGVPRLIGGPGTGHRLVPRVVSA